MLPFCPRCGAESKPDRASCWNCWAALDVPEPKGKKKPAAVKPAAAPKVKPEKGVGKKSVFGKRGKGDAAPEVAEVMLGDDALSEAPTSAAAAALMDDTAMDTIEAVSADVETPVIEQEQPGRKRSLFAKGVKKDAKSKEDSTPAAKSKKPPMFAKKPKETVETEVAEPAAEKPKKAPLFGKGVKKAPADTPPPTEGEETPADAPAKKLSLFGRGAKKN